MNKNSSEIKRNDTSSFLISIFILLVLILIAVFIAIINSPSAVIARLKPVYLTDDKGIVMALVPEGSFVMGSYSGDEDEQPVSTVNLRSYYIDKFEVTNASYQSCVDVGVCPDLQRYIYSTPYGVEYSSKIDNFPVVNVDWYMAKTYCEWRGSRLPTEAEWEKAAHGPYARTYPWGEEIDSTYANYGHFWGEQPYGPVAVGSYEKGKSVYGVYDMSGNVREWVSSLYKPYPYVFRDGRENFESEDYRVQRGGGWSILTSYLRTSERTYYTPAHKSEDVGFRCARSIP